MKLLIWWQFISYILISSDIEWCQCWRSERYFLLIQLPPLHVRQTTTNRVPTHLFFCHSLVWKVSTKVLALMQYLPRQRKSEPRQLHSGCARGMLEALRLEFSIILNATCVTLFFWLTVARQIRLHRNLAGS